MNLRSLRYGLLILPLLLGLYLQAADPEITVYKLSTCSCCMKWVEHLRANGFKVTVHEVPDVVPYKTKYGVPSVLQSCHTAMVDGYVIEGHVPAAEIRRLLKDRPEAKGLAVPGMPFGSPGMEGSRKDSYAVLLLKTDGSSSVYQEYRGD